MHTQSATVPESAPESATISPTALNSASLSLLLEWWPQRKRVTNLRNHLDATLPKGNETYLQAYHRLMEIYSVVKSGGVQARTEAVKAFVERESVLLNQRLGEIETATDLSENEKQEERAKIEQELKELTQSNNWRIQMLSSIAPEEEEAVRQRLSDIEQTLIQTQSVQTQSL
ncbi:MAG: hypothetical protein AAF716_21565 [Cyanobacteria bacterium P01_D01_bin.1]